MKDIQQRCLTGGKNGETAVQSRYLIAELQQLYSSKSVNRSWGKKKLHSICEKDYA